MAKQSPQPMTTNTTPTKDGFKPISLPGEYWLPAKGKSLNYFVSNMGRLLTTRYKGGYKTKVMTPALDNCGYLRTVVDGKTIKIHRLIAETFIPNPLKKPQVNHINHNRSDNRVENLEWVTRQENIKHMMNHSRQSRNWGEKSGTHIIKENQVKEILLARKESNLSNLALANKLAKNYPLKPDSIRDILKGKTWKYLQESSKLP